MDTDLFRNLDLSDQDKEQFVTQIRHDAAFLWFLIWYCYLLFSLTIYSISDRNIMDYSLLIGFVPLRSNLLPPPPLACNFNKYPYRSFRQFKVYFLILVRPRRSRLATLRAAVFNEQQSTTTSTSTTTTSSSIATSKSQLDLTSSKYEK